MNGRTKSLARVIFDRSSAVLLPMMVTKGKEGSKKERKKLASLVLVTGTQKKKGLR